jgi:hypothetical protein
MDKYFRICVYCSAKIVYKTRITYSNAKRKNRSCGCLRLKALVNANTYKIQENSYVKGILVKKLFPCEKLGRKALLECPLCKEDWITRLKSITSNKAKTCRKCIYKSPNRTQRINYEGIIKGYLKYVRDAPSVKGARSIVVKCIKEGCTEPERTILANSWSTGNSNSCSCIKDSIGVCKIKEFLQSKDIKYTTEFIFDDCKNKNPLRFDFRINIKSKIYLIEFNGPQHYKAVSFWGGELGLQAIKNSDKIKLKYCKDKGLSLLTILYNQQTQIPQLLTKFLGI